jgi:hypothetical protein
MYVVGCVWFFWLLGVCGWHFSVVLLWVDQPQPCCVIALTLEDYVVVSVHDSDVLFGEFGFKPIITQLADGNESAVL